MEGKDVSSMLSKSELESPPFPSVDVFFRFVSLLSFPQYLLGNEI